MDKNCNLCGHKMHESTSPYPEDSECGEILNDTEYDAIQDICKCRAGHIGFDWPKRCCE